MDTKIFSMSDTKIDTRENFQNMYSKALYSLYPNLFTKTDVTVLNDELFRDEGVFGRKL